MTKSKHKWTKAKKVEILFYCSMLLWPVLQFAVFYIGVNFRTFTLAFQEYSVVTNTYDFVKFDNFAKVLKDMFSLYIYKSAFTNSLKYYVGGLCVSLPLGLLFSYYIFKKRFLSGVMKVVLFMPSIMPIMVLVILYQMVVNCVIPDWFHITPLLSILSTKVWGTVFVFNIWIGFGGAVLLYVGAMSNVTEGTLEAAQIDGVNSAQEFFYIILPQIFSTISVFLIRLPH